MLLEVANPQSFEYLEHLELNNPSARKIDGNRIIYDGHGIAFPKTADNFGPPRLCDFGEARSGDQFYTDEIQPFIYQAPEVILEVPWIQTLNL